MIESHILALITKSLSANTTTEEEKELLDWINLDPANQQAFDGVKNIWSLAGNLKEDFEPNTEKDWQKLKFKIGVVPVTRVRSRLYQVRWLRPASVFVAIAGLFLLIMIMIPANKVKEANYAKAPEKAKWLEFITTDSGAVVFLPDSSKVWVNKNSKLSYPSFFNDTVRTVYLSGESYFEVQKDPKRPFNVYTGNTRVRVLGTSFNVKEMNEDVEVSVLTGRVEFSSLKDSGAKLVLEKDETGTFNQKSTFIKKEKSNKKNFSKGNLKAFINKVKKAFKKKRSKK